MSIMHFIKVNLYNIETGSREAVLETQGAFVMSVAFVCDIFTASEP